VPFRDKADRLSLRLLTDIIRLLDGLLQKGSLEFRGLAYVKLTLKRLDERRWLLSARGEVRYDVELTTEEALLMALAVKDAGLLIWPPEQDVEGFSSCEAGPLITLRRPWGLAS